MGIKHAHNATQSDGSDSSLLQPTDWNADHVINDIIIDTFGTPTTAFEFETSSLTGLTAMGSPAVENADTSIPGHYYLQVAIDSGLQMSGRYASAPSAPFTAIARISDITLTQNGWFHHGLYIGESTPGSMLAIGPCDANIKTWTATPTTNITVVATSDGSQASYYLAIKVNSATSVDLLWSRNGYVWLAVTTARNPSFTIGSIGWASRQDNTPIFAVAIDYLRIWESALTFAT